MKKFKLKLFSLALIIIVLALVCQVRFVDMSFSYASNGSAASVVTSGNIKLDVYEVSPLEDGLTIIPGESIPWCVEVKNTGNHPFYLRVKLVSGVDEQALSAEDCFKLNIDATQWLYQDGWYYYTETVNPGETTPYVFSHVEIVGSAVDNRYLGKTLTLTVKAQAVQSENNPLTDNDPRTAVGWPQE